jgi:cellulose synthase/poly-beta-1,6-N-acetylglucosamine synthase-like glycosyltransferase
MHITALIPAHNEAEWIHKIVRNLQNQTRPPDRIIIMSDNSTDDTMELTRQAGAEAWESVDNTMMKAGALNQALGEILPDLEDEDFIFMQDADTLPAPTWLAVALTWQEGHPDSVVSGRYASPPTGASLLRIVQENEFARDGRAINRRSNHTRIVVGTSTLFPVPVLRAVVEARAAGELPGPSTKDVYSLESITEDYELTLALKTLGYGTYSPPECDAETDVMPDIKSLWKQRKRWQRGAFTDLHKYGFTKITRWYYAAQASWVFGMVTLLMIFAQVGLVLYVNGHFKPAIIWIGTLPLFIAYRVLSVRKTGWKGMLVASLLLPEIAYDFFRYAIYLVSAFNAAFGGKAKW